MKKILALMICFLLLVGGLNASFAEAAGNPDAGAPESNETASPYGKAIGYIRVTVGSQTGWLPVPENGEYSYPLEQVLPDGSHTLNVIHVSSEGVYMESSTCENQDCVEQGMVTFDNLNTRILGRFIICLPNCVMLELFTLEEVAAILTAAQEP